MEKGENKLVVAVVSLLVEEQLLHLSQCQRKTCIWEQGGRNQGIKGELAKH